MSNSPQDPRLEGRGITPRQVAAIVVAVLAIVVVLQNREEVTLTLLVVEVTMPLWIASLVLLVIGALVGWLLASRRRRARAG